MESSEPLSSPNASHRLTYTEYIQQELSHSYEIKEGVVQIVPSPSVDHQQLISHLHILLVQDIPRTENIRVLFAPLDLIVQKNPLQTYQPDIMLFRKEKGIVNEDRLVEGPPDLIVEVLSPGSRHKDYVEKRAVYENLGVPEYWIVDNETKSISRFFQNEQNSYGWGELVREGELTSQVYPFLTLSLDELFDPDT